MSTTESIKRKLQTAQELQSVVKSIKAITAASIKQYETAVESLSQYNQTIEMGLQVVLRTREALIVAEPTKNNRLGAIIFRSDQGMCGQFKPYAASDSDAVSNFSSPLLQTWVFPERQREILSHQGKPGCYLPSQ